MCICSQIIIHLLSLLNLFLVYGSLAIFLQFIPRHFIEGLKDWHFSAKGLLLEPRVIQSLLGGQPFCGVVGK